MWVRLPPPANSSFSIPKLRSCALQSLSSLWLIGWFALPAVCQTASSLSKPLQQAVLGAVQTLPSNWQQPVANFLSAPTLDPAGLDEALHTESLLYKTPALPKMDSLPLSKELSPFFEDIKNEQNESWLDAAVRIRALDNILSRHAPEIYRTHTRIADLLASEALPLAKQKQIESRAAKIVRSLLPENRNRLLNLAPDPTVMIQPATLDDIPQIAEIDQLVFRHTTGAKSNDWFEKEYLGSRSIFKVIRRGDRVAASIYVSHKASDNLYIENLTVHPDFRKRGYGQILLLDGLLTALSGPNIRTVTLHVNIWNKRAIALYKKLGFLIEDRLKDFYKKGWDGYLMSLQIRP